MHEVPIEDTTDLHTFQSKQVRIVVEEYLYQALERGFDQVRIIHGKGIGVQREIVRSILEKHPVCAGIPRHSGPRLHGGEAEENSVAPVYAGRNPLPALIEWG